MSAPPTSSSTPVPASLAEIAVHVERRLGDLFDREIRRWAELTEDMTAPLVSLQKLVMAGGKRLRPAFCYWAFIGAGGDPGDEQIIEAGAAFELLQAFALVHDDVMDGSSTRRGFPTAHLAFADHHDASDWRGEQRRFGEGVAILIGDIAHVYADRFMRSAPREALDVWDELRIELNAGQYLDILGTARRDTDYERARRIARYKAGKYTIERPLHVGAALAGRLDDLAAPLSAYGDPLGEAFQLRDDILGAFGEATLTGKPVGDDLREGKPTPLLAVAWKHANADQLVILDKIGDPDLDDAAIAVIQQTVIDTGAVQAIEEEITRLAETALDAIATTDITTGARDELSQLAHFVAWRHS